MNARDYDKAVSYRSAKTGRTAEHVNNTLTVFDGLEIIAVIEADDDLSSGEIFELIDSVKTREIVADLVPAKAETQTLVEGDYPDWFTTLLFQEQRMSLKKFEEQAYRGYVSHGLSMTDGHFAPKTLQSWLQMFRKDVVGQLYYGNDNRHELAPYALEYERSMRRLDQHSGRDKYGLGKYFQALSN